MSKYLLITNIWNERGSIEHMFQMVSEFTKTPDLWVWISDGSNDGSEFEIERCAMLYDLPVVAVILPPKSEGCLRYIGDAYNYAFGQLNLRQLEFDFICIMDVDSKFHPDYTRVAAGIIERRFGIGIVAAYSRGVKYKMPMGNGKCTRWSVVQHINKFWSPAPDTFLNIKCEAMGLDWYIMESEVGEDKGGGHSRNTTAKGARHAGWMWSYASGSFWGAVKRTVYRMLKRQYGIAFWYGFLDNELAFEEPEHSYDEDVMRFYGRKR